MIYLYLLPLLIFNSMTIPIMLKTAYALVRIWIGICENFIWVCQIPHGNLSKAAFESIEIWIRICWKLHIWIEQKIYVDLSEAWYGLVISSSASTCGLVKGSFIFSRTCIYFEEKITNSYGFVRSFLELFQKLQLDLSKTKKNHSFSKLEVNWWDIVLDYL